MSASLACGQRSATRLRGLFAARWLEAVDEHRSFEQRVDIGMILAALVPAMRSSSSRTTRSRAFSSRGLAGPRLSPEFRDESCALFSDGRAASGCSVVARPPLRWCRLLSLAIVAAPFVVTPDMWLSCGRRTSHRTESRARAPFA
jgi:hypothetical protein